jgi:tetratricopeptide (TPR) repeat protein
MFIIKYNLEIRINPKDKYSYLQRAHHKALIGDFKGAILDYDKLIEFSHKDSVIFFAYEGRGDAKSEIEDYEGAIVDYNKAIAQYPSRSTFLQRGKARYKLGDIKNACLDWKKVEPLEWEYSMDSDYSDSPDDTYDEAIELRKKYCR